MDGPADACPETDAILSFAQGLLAPVARDRVADHLDGCRQCSALVLEAARALGLEQAEPAQETMPPSIALPRVLGRGTPLARYIVLDPIGTGGLGEVYAAYDPELDRRVAIKLLKPYANVGRAMKFERRLVQEGRALAKVSHPNVVAVHDVGTVGDRVWASPTLSESASPTPATRGTASQCQRVFIAMELVEGVTLGAWLAAAPRSWTAIRDVMLGAAAGLHEAHRRGLVHRDFKPSNVIVDRDDRAKVLDFGLARAAAEVADEGSDSSSARDIVVGLERPATDDAAATGTGALVGTPAYMAPEQITFAKVDARADQFAFCVTLYEALYGRRPFAGKTLDTLLEAIESGRVLDPTVDRRPPPSLRRAIVRGLACDPAKRYESMHALATALTEDRRAWRRPWVALAAIAVLGSVATWAVVASDRAVASPAGVDVVDALTHEARAAAARSYFVYPPVEDADYRTAYRVVVELERLAGPAASLGRERATTLRAEFADTLARLGDRFWESEGGAPFAIDYYAQALVFDGSDARAAARVSLTPGELASLRAKADDLSFTPSELAAAQSLAVLAEPDDAERKRRLAALYEGEHAPSVSTTARLERVLGAEVGEAIRTSDPRTSARRAETRTPQPPPEIVEEAVEPTPKRSAPAKYTTAAEARTAGRKAFSAGRFGEAEALLERALELDAKDADAAHALAELHFERGAPAKAVVFAERAANARPKDARHRILLGDCLLKLGRKDEARAQYEAARDLGHASADARLRKVGGGE